MILSDTDLLERIEAGDDLVAPLARPELQIQPASIDVCLGNTFAAYTEGDEEIDPFDERTFQTQTWIEQDPFIVIQPKEFLLASTVETITVPEDLVCRLEGRSTYGRLGVVIHITAGFGDPGFSGQITLEIFNANVRPVRLYIGERIGQIVFEELKTPATRGYGGPRSKYQHQQGATPPRADVAMTTYTHDEE